MMNTMSNNKLNIDELEMVNGGGFWDALVETVGSILDTTKDVVCEYGPVGAYYIFATMLEGDEATPSCTLPLLVI